jgi:hypothetical protein
MTCGHKFISRMEGRCFRYWFACSAIWFCSAHNIRLFAHLENDIKTLGMLVSWNILVEEVSNNMDNYIAAISDRGTRKRRHLMLYRLQSSTPSTNTNNVDWHCWKFCWVQDRRSCKAWRRKMRRNHCPYLTVGTTKYNTSKACMTCFHLIIHPRMSKSVEGIRKILTNNGTSVCLNRNCST